jgi:hypothetical protein
MAWWRVDEVEWTPVRSSLVISALSDLSGWWHSTSGAAASLNGA